MDTPKKTYKRNFWVEHEPETAAHRANIVIEV
jgi:hypothetical protein